MISGSRIASPSSATIRSTQQVRSQTSSINRSTTVVRQQTQAQSRQRASTLPAPTVPIASAVPIPPPSSAAPVPDLKPNLDAGKREWQPWDGEFGARRTDARYAVAQTVAKDSLSSKDVVDISTCMCRLDSLLTGSGPVTAKERQALVDMANDASALLYPDEAIRPSPNAGLLARINASDFSRDEAQELQAQAVRVHRLKLYLGRTKGVTDEERRRLAAEYDVLAAILHQ